MVVVVGGGAAGDHADVSVMAKTCGVRNMAYNTNKCIGWVCEQGLSACFAFFFSPNVGPIGTVSGVIPGLVVWGCPFGPGPGDPGHRPICLAAEVEFGSIPPPNFSVKQNRTPGTSVRIVGYI